MLGFPKDAEEARRIYATRFWYDSAGPVYPRQIKGLMAHDVLVSQMVFRLNRAPGGQVREARRCRRPRVTKRKKEERKKRKQSRAEQRKRVREVGLRVWASR